MVTTVTMIDTVGSNAGIIPSNAVKVAGYITGSGDVPWPANQLSRFSGRIVTIDQLPASPGNTSAMVCDVETNAATPADAVAWAKARIAMGFRPACYVQRSRLTELVNALIAGGVNGGDIWLADWSMSMAEATQNVIAASGPWPIVAVQYASPSSNPSSILPGTDIPLSRANCDLSIANAAWPVMPPIKPLIAGFVVTNPFPNSIQHVTSSDGGITWKV